MMIRFLIMEDSQYEAAILSNRYTEDDLSGLWKLQQIKEITGVSVRDLLKIFQKHKICKKTIHQNYQTPETALAIAEILLYKTTTRRSVSSDEIFEILNMVW